MIGHHDAGVADHHAAGFQNKPALEPGGGALGHGGVVRGQGRVLVAIADAEAAAEVEALDGMAFGAQASGHDRQSRKSALIGLELGQLRADMHGQPDQRYPSHGGGGLSHGGGVFGGDAEFIMAHAGGYLGVGLGVDIRIDAKRYRRANPACFGEAVQKLQLGQGFDIELKDSLIKGETDLIGGLADPREDDAARRHTGGQRLSEFAARDHVGAGAEGGEDPHDRLVAIGFQRIADGRRNVGKGLGSARG